MNRLYKTTLMTLLFLNSLPSFAYDLNTKIGCFKALYTGANSSSEARQACEAFLDHKTDINIYIKTRTGIGCGMNSHYEAMEAATAVQEKRISGLVYLKSRFGCGGINSHLEAFSAAEASLKGKIDSECYIENRRSSQWLLHDEAMEFCKI
ncbi:MAG: hypothetical protein AB7I27_05275 [Bacteriovoracaceae bacterium]